MGYNSSLSFGIQITLRLDSGSQVPLELSESFYSNTFLLCGTRNPRHTVFYQILLGVLAQEQNSQWFCNPLQRRMMCRSQNQTLCVHIAPGVLQLPDPPVISRLQSLLSIMYCQSQAHTAVSSAHGMLHFSVLLCTSVALSSKRANLGLTGSCVVFLFYPMHFSLLFYAGVPSSFLDIRVLH